MTPVSNPKAPPWSRLWLIIGLFILVGVFEFSTPPEYVFGYLFIGPILLANTHLSRVSRLRLTLLACFVTVLDAWVSDFYSVKISTIANRIIVIFALLVTNFLSTRNRLYQEELSQQTAKLQAQEKLASVREDFASTLTHDLKTPLLGAIETLHAFAREDFGSVLFAQKKVLATMIRSHQNSLQMVETLLDVYRNDIEGLKLHLEPVDLVAIAQEVAATLTDLASSRRVYISFNYGESEFRKFLWVYGDVFQLQRVFTNLLTNAINHSPRGGRIEVALESRFSEQIVKVIDSGSGIRLEELPHLFERFYQGQSDRQAKGSGLGLYLSRQIIEAHGGKIWAENLTPNGAIFGFSLPALER
ncbi:HAMP domain-containing histidine kinase [Aetokthonos hydrillicola Thurmond2011]|uniref:histidine kinase n=1 Tax=Aetokthonos hydrillicola Thurmond2011 TaxID=2712845 RepID=A0AAP5I9V4_9CYAN|nr:HAMP domain-containing sensor histidine kinase [Aetokthonos hydrillicola]MBO3458213.1 HAMP domain-containing histidine kinase [Aetokthonos hydrillicola CCALA 1050]MBW4584433.1 HAMP domain-containing histidine kinase [Aetokthonos hydrillicola CCALA 1050]MDR9896394.1 HAMP domain-containing histidine kinase [Aetokthonos hydrillicola Thurmond2011]